MKKIAVIGSINMDLSCSADRHPGKGETVSGRNLRYIPGGKGANQAVAAARLGGCVTMFGCVGDDAFADQLVENLRDNGIETRYIWRISGISSGIALITVAQKDNAIVVIPGANDCVTRAYLTEVKEHILEADILLVQNEVPQESVAYVMELAHEFGKTLIYNPAPARPMDLQLLEKVSFVTPNEHEAELLFPEHDTLEAMLEAWQGRLIVTLGSEGSAAWINGAPVRIPARPAKVVDTTGAGDTFNGAFAYALSRELPMEQALRFANVAASLSTEQYGAQGGMPTLEMVEMETL